MLFERMRRQVKWIILAVTVAFAVTLLYVGGPGLFTRREPAEAAIARVNGETIGQAAFQQAYASQLRAYEQTRGLVRPTDLEEVRYQALNRLIMTRLILQAARDEGIRVSRSEVNKRLAEIRDAFPTERDYRRELERNRLTESALRKAIEENLMAEGLQAKLSKGITVTDEEVARAYEQVRVSHILIRPQGNDEQAWKQAEARAQRVYERLKAGADFAEVAKTASDDDSTREHGGDLGPVSRGMLPEALDQAAFSMKDGEISKPLKTELGYHILKVTDRREARGEEFEKAKTSLVEQLRAEKANETFTRWLNDLRQQASVEILDPQLAARDAVARGDLDKALELYQKALESHPNDAYVHYGMARVLSARGRSDEALTYLARAAELEPNDPILQLELGNAYRQKGETGKAAAALRKASELSPMDLQVHLMLYAVFSNMGLKEDAAREQKELEKIQQVMEQQRRLQEELAKRLQEQSQQNSGSQAQPPASGANEAGRGK